MPLLLAEVDRQLGLARLMSRHLGNARARPVVGEHSLLDMLRPHVYALALGPEDLNDHGELRHDPALQPAASGMETLASPSTLCRLEQRADRETAMAMHQALFDQFVGRMRWCRGRLVPDVDATDAPLHSEQERQQHISAAKVSDRCWTFFSVLNVSFSIFQRVCEQETTESHRPVTE